MNTSGSLVDTQAGTEADVKAEIDKAMVALLQLKNIWQSKVLSLRNKIRIFNTIVKAVLLHGVGRDMEDRGVHHKEDTNLCQQMSKNNPWYLVADGISNERL